MRVFRVATVVSVIALLGYSLAYAQIVDCRTSVSSRIQASCTGDNAVCIDAVKLELANAGHAGCGSGGICVAQGLADATSAINGRNSDLATSMAATVATDGAACLQVAFGAALDGVGTAAIPVVPPLAGSAG